MKRLLPLLPLLRSVFFTDAAEIEILAQRGQRLRVRVGRSLTAAELRAAAQNLRR